MPGVHVQGKSRTLALGEQRKRRRFGFARVAAQHRAVALEDLEHFVEHVAQHLLEVVGSLHRAVDAVQRLEEPHVLPALRLGAPQLFVARAQRVLRAPPSGAEFTQQEAQRDEDRQRQHVIRRRFERMHRGHEQVRSPRYADQRSQQAGPTSAVPGAQHHCRDRELVNGGAFRETAARCAGTARAQPTRRQRHSASADLACLAAC